MAPGRKYVCVPGTQCLPLRERQVRPLYSAVPLASLGCDKPRIFPVSFATPFFPSASSSPFPWRGCHLLLPHPVLSVFLVSPFSFALAQNPSWIGVESRRRILCQPCRNFLTGPGTASAVQKVRQGGRQTSPPIFSGWPGRILHERKGKQSRKETDSTGFGCARGPATGALDDFQKGYKTAHESVPTPPLES